VDRALEEATDARDRMLLRALKANSGVDAFVRGDYVYDLSGFLNAIAHGVSGYERDAHTKMVGNIGLTRDEARFKNLWLDIEVEGGEKLPNPMGSALDRYGPKQWILKNKATGAEFARVDSKGQVNQSVKEVYADLSDDLGPTFSLGLQLPPQRSFKEFAHAVVDELEARATREGKSIAILPPDLRDMPKMDRALYERALRAQAIAAALNYDYEIPQKGVLLELFGPGGVAEDVLLALGGIPAAGGARGPAFMRAPRRARRRNRNASGGPTQQGAPAIQTSGLIVVPRPGMTSRTITASNGNRLTVWGQAEPSTSTTRGHAEAMNNLAERLAATGEYEYVTLQRSWRTATGREGTSARVPDVIGVRRNGVVDAWEVRSATDVRDVLIRRLREGMNTLPPARRGTIDVIPPEPPAP
jgi:hypothetical protein